MPSKNFGLVPEPTTMPLTGDCSYWTIIRWRALYCFAQAADFGVLVEMGVHHGRVFHGQGLHAGCVEYQFA